MSQTVNFDMNGNECGESHLSLAQIRSVHNVERYFVKFFDFGSQRGTPVNPNGPGYENTMLRTTSTGASMASFKSVSKEAFDLYIKFLQTKNELFHRTVINLTS